MEERIVEYLKSKYHPLGIILYGSRASDSFLPQSDWDFALFLDKDVEARSEEIDGQSVDVNTIKIPISTEEMVKEFGGSLQNARVVFDTNGAVANILAEFQKIYAGGRNFTALDRQNRINLIDRRLKKIEDNIDNPNVFFLHLGFFFDRAMRYWFELKHNRWVLPPREALKIIEKEDPVYSKWLSVLSSSTSNQEKTQIAKEIVENLQTTPK